MAHDMYDRRDAHGHSQACPEEDVPWLWGHDHDEASRQLGLEDPSVAFALLITPNAHYIADCGGVGPLLTCQGEFETFEDLNTALDIIMKASTRQPPAASHKIQGTQVTFDATGTVVAPTENRRTRLLSCIDEVLKSNNLSCSLATSLAGKLCFLHTALSGRVGKRL